ncbi:Rne/Rng family ribonuclease [Alsobacter sp. R-9]
MANKMLIDASHPEETRVVVVRGNRVEEFDFESANKKQLRGNIYLAKVIRVEPSLQAAFVDYGGNRHGFLAFSEIHPDYYQIPVADRQALLAEEARQERDAEAEEERASRRNRRRRGGERRPQAAAAETAETVSEAAAEGEGGEPTAAEAPADGDAVAEAPAADEVSQADAAPASEASGASDGDDEDGDDEAQDEADVIESVGSEDAMEEVPERPRQVRRQYKIQEVIKRRQVLLVQVVKEERGNKGAALTTYLSLAGRYSVLMPNTGRGGGISRKITSAADRKRLKTVAQELEVPEGMGVILRTAGASRTKAEIKRDFEYLMRLWESVRELTLQSSAPALTYEEGSLVKRAIRDLYNKDIDEVLVAGEGAYKDAKDFMRMLMPSHAKNVKPYREVQPIFAKFGVEAQLDAMFSNQVTLKSGGYIVINQTEALVSIDVNSGRATREHNIEDTALKTNCEAADEVARQLRLRDLAGLIVIDFIDMEEKRNNRTVERRLKEALKNDRARIQVGRISAFGLLEMSRQRIRTGVLEGSTVPCPHCAGAGIVRAVPSVALHVLRAVEEMLIKSNAHHLIVRTRTEVALYILNQKRSHLRGLEDRFGVDITILADDSHTGSHAFAIERGEAIANPRPIPTTVQVDSVVMPEDEEPEVEEPEAEEDEEETESEGARGEREPRGPRGDRPRFEGERNGDRNGEGRGDGEGGRRRRRRRRRRGGRGGEGRPEGGAAPMHAGGPMPLDAPQPDVTGAPFAGTHTFEPQDAVSEAEVEELALNEAEGGEPVASPASGERDGRRRRGRRGGRRTREGGDEAPAEAGAEAPAEPAVEVVAEAVVVAEEPKPARKPRTRKPRAAAAAAPEATAPEATEATQAAPEPVVAAPVEASPEPVAVAPVAVEPPAQEPLPEPITTEPVVIGSEPATPRKAGWWAKAKQALGGS